MNTITEQMFIPNAAESQPSSSTERQISIPENMPVNLENVSDFSNVCRTCATITEFVIPIFSGEGLQNNLADKIHKHLPIGVSESDVLPRVVCYQCASTLLAWHELVQCCVQADQALRAKIAADTRTHNASKAQKSTNQKSLLAIQYDAQSKPNTDSKVEGNETDSSKVTELLEQSKVLSVGADGRRSAWCGLCNKGVSVVSWRRHLRLHNGEKRYSCHTCGRAFADSGNLARHVRTLHGQERPFSCPTCDKTFSRRAHLDDHIKSHSEQRPYVCDVCGKASKSLSALRMHARTHGARTCACPQCGASFKRAAELRAHRSVHSGERAHVCACGKAFRLRSQLNAHARIHQRTENPS